MREINENGKDKKSDYLTRAGEKKKNSVIFK